MKKNKNILRQEFIDKFLDLQQKDKTAWSSGIEQPMGYPERSRTARNAMNKQWELLNSFEKEHLNAYPDSN